MWEQTEQPDTLSYSKDPQKPKIDNDNVRTNKGNQRGAIDDEMWFMEGERSESDLVPGFP
jgi:hypothetical protein